MSDPFSHKDYGEYFERLSKQIETEAEGSSRHIQQKPAVPEQTARRRKTRIRPAAILVFFAAVALVAILITVSVVKGFSAKPDGKPAAGQETKISAGQKTETPAEKKQEIIVLKETENTVSPPADNDAESIIMINSETNEIVVSREPLRRLYPASTTKIMTVLVAAEQTENFDDTFVMTREITDSMYVAEATVAGFSPGEEVTVTDLLYGTILRSGGDAALGLAEKIAGSEEAFVALMNQKAAELGLRDTHFTNVTGLFDQNHYTTAYDMAIMLKTALKVPVCEEVLSTYMHTTKATPQHPQGVQLSATLFDFMYGTEPETATILGGKTGFVNESGYCIATYGKNNTTGTEYIAVTMKNSGRWPAIYGQIALYKQFAQ